MKLSLFVADEMRTLDDGKLIAIGLFTDRVVVLKVHGDIPLPTEDSAFAIPLSIAACLTDLPPDVPFEVSGRIEPPTAPVSQRLKGTIGAMPPGASANLVVRLDPLIIPEFGMYRFVVSVPGCEDLSETFEVRVERSEDPAHSPQRVQRIQRPNAEVSSPAGS